MTDNKKAEVLNKQTKDLLKKFLTSEQEVYTSGKSVGKKKWKKVNLKKLTGFQLCLDADSKPVLCYNDGSQRMGLFIKNSTQYGQIKGQMLRNFVQQIDYLDALVKFLYKSDVNTDIITEI